MSFFKISERRKWPEPKEHRGQPSSLLLLLHQPLRSRFEAPGRGGHEAVVRQGQHRAGHRQGRLSQQGRGQGVEAEDSQGNQGQRNQDLFIARLRQVSEIKGQGYKHRINVI